MGENGWKMSRCTSLLIASLGVLRKYVYCITRKKAPVLLFIKYLSNFYGYITSIS
jgi:hypothetical protein